MKYEYFKHYFIDYGNFQFDYGDNMVEKECSQPCIQIIILGRWWLFSILCFISEQHFDCFE
nr:MAG TPA: hypothetical protein [Bacteriophage sp.]